MRKCALFFLVMIVVFLSSGVKNTLSQEKRKATKKQIEMQKVKDSTTTTIIVPERESLGKGIKKSSSKVTPKTERWLLHG